MRKIYFIGRGDVYIKYLDILDGSKWIIRPEYIDDIYADFWYRIIYIDNRECYAVFDHAEPW